MAADTVYFLSDLHLGAPYIKDEHEAERHVCRFLDSVKDDAKEIMLVGDILDYWYEYRTVVPRGFVRFFGKLAELSDAGIKITWFIGNHDIWIFDYLPSELNIEVLDGILQREIDGRHFVISHGDGVGRRSFTFRAIRSIFRNRIAQFLYAGIHPRWTVPFASSWSAWSRKSHENDEEPRSVAAMKGLQTFCAEYVREHPATDYFIFGHLHEVADLPVEGSSARMIVLGDWIDKFTYAKYKEGKLTLETYRE